MKNEALYIKKLQKVICNKAKINPFKKNFCYRGMQMSEKEFQTYVLYENIYIPSFLSTSKNDEKFYKSNNNCLIVIKLRNIPNNALIIKEEMSIYACMEEEILFACYSKFKIIEKRKDFLYKNCYFDYFICLEHLNEPLFIIDQRTVLMINYLGF